jgi:hypothetical protein
MMDYDPDKWPVKNLLEPGEINPLTPPDAAVNEALLRMELSKKRYEFWRRAFANAAENRRLAEEAEEWEDYWEGEES